MHHTVDYNLWAANSNLANPIGSHARTGAPNFVQASANPTLANFHLQVNSAAINAGTLSYAPTTDKDGNLRSASGAIDLGCYEYANPNTATQQHRPQVVLSVYPNPATTTLYIDLLAANTQPLTLDIYNALGQKVVANQPIIATQFTTLSIANLANGAYFLLVSNDHIVVAQAKFIK